MIMRGIGQDNAAETMPDRNRRPSGKTGLTRRQRWMLFPVYVVGALLVLMTALHILSPTDPEISYDMGPAYCAIFAILKSYNAVDWLINGLSVAVVSALYWLARQDRLLLYLVVWAVWLFRNALALLFFGPDVGFC